MAIYYQRAGDFENAIVKYRAVLQQNELNAGAHNNLGLLYLDKGLLDDAVRELQRAVIIDPGHATARLNLGVAMMRQNKTDAAAAEFRAVLAAQPRNVDAMINLALVEAPTARERAKELLLQAIVIAPRNAAAHYNLAVLFDETGDGSRALEHYRAFLSAAGPDMSARVPAVRARIDTLSKR